MLNFLAEHYLWYTIPIGWYTLGILSLLLVKIFEPEEFTKEIKAYRQGYKEFEINTIHILFIFAPVVFVVCLIGYLTVDPAIKLGRYMIRPREPGVLLSKLNPISLAVRILGGKEEELKKEDKNDKSFS